MVHNDKPAIEQDVMIIKYIVVACLAGENLKGIDVLQA